MTNSVKKHNRSIIDINTQGVGMNLQGYASDAVVSDIQVSTEFLQAVLARFKVESILDEDGEIEIKEGLGPVVFIRLDRQRHWIIFHTAFSTPTLDEAQRRDFAGHLSSSLAMSQFSSTDDGISMEYFMYYRGSLNISQFMAVAQRFGSLAFTAIKCLVTFPSRSDERQTQVTASKTVN